MVIASWRNVARVVAGNRFREQNRRPRPWPHPWPCRSQARFDDRCAHARLPRQILPKNANTLFQPSGPSTRYGTVGRDAVPRRRAVNSYVAVLRARPCWLPLRARPRSWLPKIEQRTGERLGELDRRRRRLGVEPPTPRGRSTGRRRRRHLSVAGIERRAARRSRSRRRQPAVEAGCHASISGAPGRRQPVPATLPSAPPWRRRRLGCWHCAGGCGRWPCSRGGRTCAYLQ